MSTAKLTLIDMQRYMKTYNDDLFSLMTLPSDIDKDVFTGNILLRGGEFEVMYADPDFLKLAIELWSKKWYRTFDKWVKALAIEYAPLENYDRKEDYTHTLNKGITTSASGSSGNTRTFNNEDKETLNTSNTTEKTVSAYDSSTYQPAEKVTSGDSGTDTFNHTGTITDAGTTGSSGSEKENSKSIHDGRIHGNIGVTTSQQMLKSELDIAEWNLYEHMTDLFLSEFIIPIYS